MESSDDESVLDDDIEKHVRDILATPLDPPLPCPVCSEASTSKGRYRAFPDFKSLRQHASERIKDSSREMSKLRHLHEELILCLDRLEEPQIVPGPSKELLSEIGIVRKRNDPTEPDRLRTLTESVDDRKAETRECLEQKTKKRRLKQKLALELEDVTAMLQKKQEQLIKFKESAQREIDKIREETLRVTERGGNQLERMRKMIDDLNRRLMESEMKKLSPEEHNRLWEERKNLSIRQQQLNHAIIVEKESLERSEKETQFAEEEFQKAADLESDYEKACAELEAQSQRTTELTEPERVAYNNAQSVGFSYDKLPAECEKCGGRFRKKGDDAADSMLCERAGLENCECLGFCLRCTAQDRFTHCPHHGVPIGTARPFLRLKHT